MAGRIRLVLSMGAFFDFFDLRPSTPCVVRKFGYLQKKGTSLWNFAPNSRLRKFRHGISVVETCHQLSLRKVDALSVTS